MSKAKEEYIEYSKNKHLIPKKSCSPCENYIKEFEKHNSEMFQCLLDIYIDTKNECSNCSKCVSHYSIWKFIERKIKKITGKTIEEVLNEHK